MAVTEGLRNDTVWWREAVESRPSTSLHFAECGVFVWDPSRNKALSTGPDAVCAIYTDAAGTRGWGASLGDSFIQGAWPKVAKRDGINWKELRALTEAPGKWRERARRKLVPARMENSAAAAYANHCAGRSGQLARLACKITESEIRYECIALALHICGRDNAVADALSRFSIEATGGDPYPDQETAAQVAGDGFRPPCSLGC